MIARVRDWWNARQERVMVKREQDWVRWARKRKAREQR